jgi:hypothetical protein
MAGAAIQEGRCRVTDASSGERHCPSDKETLVTSPAPCGGVKSHTTRRLGEATKKSSTLDCIYILI